jgi:hypothetical protein
MGHVGVPMASVVRMSQPMADNGKIFPRGGFSTHDR